MDRTPPEIFDSILNELHPLDWESSWKMPMDGKGDLHACSLVSRSWRELAQSHLFRNTTYSFCASSERHADHTGWKTPFMPMTSRSRIRTLPMLLHFLQQSPQFVRSIRALRLDFWPQRYPPDVYDASANDSMATIFESDTDVVDFNTLLALLHSLPALITLQLCNFNLAEHTHDIPPTHRLSLSHFSLSYYRETNGALRHNGHAGLQTVLRLLDIVEKTEELGVWAYVAEAPAGVSVNIQAYEVILRSTDRLLLGLAVTQDALLSSIRRVILRTSFGTPKAYQRIVSTIGGRLLELRVQSVLAKRKYFETDSSPFLDLSGCQNLESYTLGLWARSPYNPRTEETELQSVCTSIESLPQSSLPLRRVTVAVHLVIWGYFDPHAWVEARYKVINLLEESLRRLMDRCTPPLEFITVHSTIMVEDGNTSNEQHTVPLVHEMFPTLKREGRIRIRPFSDSVWGSFHNH